MKQRWFRCSGAALVFILAAVLAEAQASDTLVPGAVTPDAPEALSADALDPTPATRTFLSGPEPRALVPLAGYAGPGWSLSFGGEVELISRNPMLFEIRQGLFLGPAVLYSESSAEGPGHFAGAAVLDWYPRVLSAGWFAVSLGLTAGVGDRGLQQGGDSQAYVLVVAHAEGNFHFHENLTFAAGPTLGIEVNDGRSRVVPGLSFGLKEGSSGVPRPLIRSAEGGPRVSGAWHGLFTFLDGRPIFVDGGGTRLEWPSGFAVGIGGGILRSRFQGAGGDLAVMQVGATVDGAWRPAPWLELAPRFTLGMAMYGWLAPDNSIEGGPALMIRPEIFTFVRVFPFLRLGIGTGYHIILGDCAPGLSGSTLSSPAFTISARVGG